MSQNDHGLPIQTAEVGNHQSTRANHRLTWLEIAIPWILLATTMAAMSGAWFWMFDLVSHFCLQVFVISFSWCCWAGLRRIWNPAAKLSFIAAMCVLVRNGILICPYYVSSVSPDSTAELQTKRLISLNVYTANQNKKAVIEYLRNRQADWVIVMEVDDKWANGLQNLRDIYPHQLLHPRSDNFGIGLPSRKPVISSRIISSRDLGLPSIVAELQHGADHFHLIATHPLPPIGASNTRHRNNQLKDIAAEVRALNQRCLVAGDLNATPWSSIFSELTSTTDLRDSALGFGVNATWDANSWWLRIPIDHVLIPKGTVVSGRRIGPSLGSDHFPVEIEFAFED